MIETPPEGRRAGQDLRRRVRRAARARRRSSARWRASGQAFFLHNRVDDIDETAERLRSLCPKLRFTVAHGQMDEQQLEERMMSFLRGEADVLVCTTIIESGIDIPQANTLIVDRADLFGLSQLYQIRGRVGRSRERAYAYLLYPTARGADAGGARTACRALSDYTELGAGFKVAMRDLELRGAGNLLGDEQSGHVAALGFELYMQMLDEAVRALDPDEDGAEPPEPVRLDVNVDAYVPADYIPYEQAKVDVHRRIAGAREISELMELRDRARGPLRRAARAAREPDHAAGGADQARSRGCDHGARSEAAGWRSRRSTWTRPPRAACARRCPERTTRRVALSCRSESQTTRLRASRRWCEQRMRCYPSRRLPKSRVKRSGLRGNRRYDPQPGEGNSACAGRFAPAPYVQRPLLSAI